ncbi:hypothetical protein LTR62_002039 [Meristemomyces frigidus]|uniref:DNA polymerase epsilon subunit D n=1 Tax=Meristemomyces frigidus TaxID=1508187 RepID=A0AAN7TH18_9PEZI|nr:hypothetical protein LTR62_002039 [Meristemomyces frigidus]
MPSRKSNVSTAPNGADEGTEVTPAKSSKEGFGVEDLSLPKSMIARLAKGVLPANTQIHKDALLALHKSATVFVSYIASNANENTQNAGKKTVMPPDVVAALKDAEFESFLPRLEAELKKYNDTQCDKRNNYRRKVKEDKASKAPPALDGEGNANDETEGEQQNIIVSPAANGVSNGHASMDDTDRPTKKLKGDAGVAVPPDQNNLDEEDMDDTNGADEADDQDDEVDDDDEAEDEVDEDDGQDETMEDLSEQLEERGDPHDEALDEEPDTD